MFSKAIVVLASISAVLAVPYITNPTASTKFTGGQSAEIKWQDSDSKPSLADYGPCKISIYVGNAIQQTSLQTLSESTDVSKLSSLTFTPDPKIGPNSDEYFIRVESLSLKDDSTPQKFPAMAFSAKFTLEGMSGEFSAAAKSQIDGQTTAPLATPTASATASGASATASGMTTSKAASATSAASSKAASSTASSAASPLTASAGWVGALLSALIGATLF